MRHPSGKPIRQTKIKSHSIWRIPSQGYETPRLRQEYNTTAIGFVHSFDQETEQEQDSHKDNSKRSQ